MSISGALFDMNKLLDVSKNVIATYSPDRIYKDVMQWAQIYNKKLADFLSDKDYALSIFSIERDENGSKRKDIAKWSDVENYLFYFIDENWNAQNCKEKLLSEYNLETVNKVLDLFVNKYYCETDDNEAWFEKMKCLSEEVGYAREVKLWRKNKDLWPGHVGNICAVVRIALTGLNTTPDLYQVIRALGTDRIKNRLLKVINS